MSTPKKIVIVGAGPSGLATAFALTDQPGWQERYSIDMYQLGWRVGGKCATGRNPDANERLQEHGIHVFGNMYFNTLQMVQKVFTEVQWDPRDLHWPIEEAFEKSVVTWNTEYFDHTWHPYLGYFPMSDGDPWTVPGGKVGTETIVQNVLFLVSQHLGLMIETHEKAHGSWWHRLWHRAEQKFADLLEGWLKDVVDQLERESTNPHQPDRAAHSAVMNMLDGLVDVLHWWVDQDPSNVQRRESFTQIDLVVTAMRGAFTDEIFAEDIDRIDCYNYREWLIHHGLTDYTQVASLPQGLPNTALSYDHGDTTAIPTMSAAAFMTFFLRQLVGAGAGAYFFKEGTGETIMKPLFRLLEQRGVRFHFFHKLTEVEVDPADTVVRALHFDVQATVKGDRYEPLRPKRGSGEPVWPDRPNYEQLEEGDRLRDEHIDLESWWTPWKAVGTRTLHLGADFDQVVLATPVATLPYTCQQILEHPATRDTWQPMVANVRTAATQAVQIWLKEPTSTLGWTTDGTVLPTDRHVGGVYGQELTSSCDFSDLVEFEDWPDDNTPKGLVYFIGALPDPEVIPDFDDHTYPHRMRERVRWSTVQFLRNVDGLFPSTQGNEIDPRSLNFDLLAQHDGGTRRGVNQFDTQYWRANIDPNERYTLSVADTVQHRLRAWESGIDNLVLAGDWTYTGFNVGSFEGSVMSGKLASLTLTGAPTLDQVMGFDFLHEDVEGPPAPFLDRPVT